MRNDTSGLIETQTRRNWVYQKRRRGWTYEKIAQEAVKEFGEDGLPGGWDRRYAYKDLKRELEKLQEENHKLAEDARDLELSRLDAALDGLWDEIERGDPEAIRAFIQVSKRRASLLGLDAPEKHEARIEGDFQVDSIRSRIQRKLLSDPTEDGEDSETKPSE